MGSSASKPPTGQLTKEQQYLNLFEDDTQLMNELVHRIGSEPSEVDFCDFGGHVKDLHLIHTKHASPSQILFAKVLIHSHETSIAMKAFNGSDKRAQRIKFEGLVYMRIVKPILDRLWTPNLVIPLGFVTCPESILQSTSLRPSLATTLKQLISSEGTLDMIVLQKPEKSLKLEAFLRDPSVTKAQVRAIYFQLLFTLEIFNRVGMRHNDLHPNNVFVQLATKQQPDSDLYCEFNVTDVWGTVVRTFYVSSSQIPLIFDFDRASVQEPFPENPMITDELCNRWGECDDVNPFFDTYKLLAHLAYDPKIEENPTAVKLTQQNAMAGNEVGVQLIKENVSIELAYLTENLPERGKKFHCLRTLKGVNLPNQPGLLARKQLERTYHGKGPLEHGKWPSEGDFVPKQYPFPFWMRSTLDILLHDPSFKPFEDVQEKVVARFTMPSREEAQKLRTLS